MNDAIRAQISAFVDGELPENEAEMLLRRMSQDRQLRQQAAEYLAMGRVMRGERSVTGTGRLRDRVAAAIDDRSLQEEFAVSESVRIRYLRPVAGVAIAATVALAAILGLQQTIGLSGVDDDSGAGTVAETIAYTVPDQPDDQLREYFLRHSASSSYFGVDSINARLVTLQLREGVFIEVEEIEATVDESEAELTDTPEPQTP
jgi:hypothetical protein